MHAHMNDAIPEASLLDFPNRFAFLSALSIVLRKQRLPFVRAFRHREDPASGTRRVRTRTRRSG